VLSQLENGDELPNCFLERSRLGRPLPCAIRLRTQRSDHMAVGQHSRLSPEILKPRSAQLGVPHCVLNVFVAQVRLQRPCVVALVGKRIAAGVGGACGGAP
jgi:hypothetical protein